MHPCLLETIKYKTGNKQTFTKKYNINRWNTSIPRKVFSNRNEITYYGSSNVHNLINTQPKRLKCSMNIGETNKDDRINIRTYIM